LPEFQFQEVFPHGEDTTALTRKLSSDRCHAWPSSMASTVLNRRAEALTLLTAPRPSRTSPTCCGPVHLTQAALDPRRTAEASTHDRYVRSSAAWVKWPGRKHGGRCP